MDDRAFCDRAAALAAQALVGTTPGRPHGALPFRPLGPGAVLLYGRDRRTAPDGTGPAVARLRTFLAFEEVGIRELGLGAAAGRPGSEPAWAMVVESRRDLEYCRRLVRKAVEEAAP